MRALSVLPVALFVACSHGELFSVPPGATVPFTPGTPAQLTLSAGTDRSVAWLPDGSGFVYSAVRADRIGDTCLQILPPTGGRASGSVCSTSLREQDSLNTYDLPAVSADGFLAMWRRSRPRGAPFLRFSEVVIASFSDASSAPFFIQFGQNEMVDDIRWLGSGSLLVVINGIPAVFPLAGSGGAFQVPVLNTTSVSTGPDSAVYFTRAGDTRVHRLRLPANDSSIAYDFAPDIPTDIDLAGTSIVAIAGQRILIADLLAGSHLVLNEFGLFYHRPAVSPDGRRIVAERNGDLWLFEVP